MAKNKTITLKLDNELVLDVCEWIDIQDQTEAITRALRDYMRLRRAEESFDRAWCYIREAPVLNEYLRPCPFCGSIPEMDIIEIKTVDRGERKIYEIKCRNRVCHGGNPSARGKSEREAINTWNSRNGAKVNEE